ncbi:hypothetical protein F0L74_23895 [Chitinophaga agrisoli]|uniref:Uncharacterized protein n=1 Tax=Chitinophaga agrisoli TaxID=2607653 RepID=A0A5B2VI48_9BACT|nr:hypothetical protein [Chitinophaga agrisoli]KAA2239253.1 hypothetical protein F0L74_23895 [Chitinophaga agrisoli]
MGKDREGKFIPLKGKPSGSGREARLGLRPTIDEEGLKRDEEMTARYTSGEDELAPNVHMRHPNRNTAKGEEEEYASQSNYKKQQVAGQAEPLPGNLTREDFTTIAAYHATTGYCITLYMPTHRSGVAVNEQQDAILLKKLLQQTQQQLVQKGLSADEAEAVLQPAFNLQQDSSFWRGQEHGLGLFIADGYFKYIQLPMSVAEQCYINHSFHIGALLPLLTNKEHFYVLALSKHKATLYEADAFGMWEVPVNGMPNGMDDVVHFEEKDGKDFFRTGGAGPGQGANYHGMGAGRPDDKENISMYFDEVDETLWKEVLSTKNTPLLLAAVDYMIPIFKKRSKYKHMMDDALIGNYEHGRITDLYEKAKEKMQPYFEQHCRQALERYANNSANGRTSSVLADVIPASYYARADVLFIQKDAQLWGAFDEQRNDLQLHDTEQPGDECLVNATAAKAVETGAEVFMLDKHQMPADSPMAAIMRY